MLSFGLNTAPQVFTGLRHTATGYLHRLGISVIPYFDDWLVRHPDGQILARCQSQLLGTLELVGFILNEKKSELDLVQDIQFLSVQLRLDLGRDFLSESKAREVIARACELSSQRVLSYQRAAQFYGHTQLGLRSYPSGSFTPETVTTTFSLFRPDKPIYTTSSIRPASPCQPTSAVAGPIFSNIRYPHPTFPGGFHDFYRCLYAGWGAHMGDSQISGRWTRSDRQLHINCLELKAVVAALRHWVSVLWGHQVLIAMDNTKVVSYINKQGGTHSLTLLHLVVDLFMWLQAQDIALRARHIPGCLNVIADHLSRPNQPISTEWSLRPEILNRIFQFWGTLLVDMFVTVHNTLLLQFISPIPEPLALAVDALSQDWQGRSMYTFPPFPLLNKVIQKLRATQEAEVILVAPWWPSQLWFPHMLRLCVDHPLFFPYRRDLLSQQGQRFISDGKSYHLHSWRLSCSITKQQDFQTRPLGLPQHLRRPSTNRM